MRKRTLAALIIGGIVAAKVMKAAQAKVEAAVTTRQAAALGDRFADDDWGNDLYASIVRDPGEAAVNLVDWSNRGLGYGVSNSPGQAGAGGRIGSGLDTAVGLGLGQAPHYTHTKMPGAAPDGSWFQDRYAPDRWNDDDNAVDPLAFADGDPSGLGLPPQMAHGYFPGQSAPGSWMKDLYAADVLVYDDNAVDPLAFDPGDPAGLGRWRPRNPLKAVQSSIRKTWAPLAKTLQKVAARPVAMISRDVRSFSRGAQSALKRPFAQLRKFQKNDPFSTMMKSRKLFHHGGGGGGGGDAGGETGAVMASDGVTADPSGIITGNNSTLSPVNPDNPDDAPQSGEYFGPYASESDPDATTPDGQIPETEAQASTDLSPNDLYDNDPIDAVLASPDNVNDMVQAMAQTSTTSDFAIQADANEDQPAPIDYIDATPDEGTPIGGRIMVNGLDWLAARADQPVEDTAPVGFDDDATPMAGLGDLCDTQGRPIQAMRPRDGWKGRRAVPISGMDSRRMQADERGNVYLWSGAQLVKVGTTKNYGGPNRVRRLVKRPWNRTQTPGLFDYSRDDSADDGTMAGVGCAPGVGCSDDTMAGLGFKMPSFSQLTWKSTFHDHLTKAVAKVDPSFAAYQHLKQKKQPIWSRYRRIWGYSGPYVGIAAAAVATYYTGGATSEALAAAIVSAGGNAAKMEAARQAANRERSRQLDADRDAALVDMRTGSNDASEGAVIADSAHPVDDPAPLSHLQPEGGSAPGELPGGDTANQYASDGVDASFLDVFDIN